MWALDPVAGRILLFAVSLQCNSKISWVLHEGLGGSTDIAPFILKHRTRWMCLAFRHYCFNLGQIASGRIECDTVWDPEPV